MTQERLAPRRRTLLLWGGVLLTGAAIWLTNQATQVAPRPVYTAEGYGGYLPAAPSPSGPARPTAPTSPAAPTVKPALDAFNAGRYPQAEAAAQQVVASSRKPGTSVPAREAARARWVLAFSAARRHDFSTARDRFAELKQAAAGERWTLAEARAPGKAQPTPEQPAKTASASPAQPLRLPDRPVSSSGEPLPTLEEEAAYQHAVLTAALLKQAAPKGKKVDPTALDAEFVQFIWHYPESPLVHAAVRRLARLHGGDVPPAAEAAWQEAMAVAQKRQLARDRERALCGPEVLAEVLRRATARSSSTADSEAGSVAELARELQTDHQGTTLLALLQAAEKNGFRAKGLQLTWDGLWKITNGPEGKRDAPKFLIAQVRPGHYVLVEDVRAGEVAVWDPSGLGPGQPGGRRYRRSDWERVWTGIALRLDR